MVDRWHRPLKVWEVAIVLLFAILMMVLAPLLRAQIYGG